MNHERGPRGGSRVVLKLVPATAWEEAVAQGTFRGHGIDVEDGFIHLSTPAQVQETAARHFAGQDDLVLVVVDAARVGDGLRFEPSRDGELFPHLYGDLPLEAVIDVVPVPLDDAGIPRVPAVPLREPTTD